MVFKVGDNVFSISYWGGHIQKGKITDVMEDGYRVDWNDGGSSGLHKKNAFKTKREAIAARKERQEKKKQDYRDMIRTPKEALEFIYNHCGQFEEYTNNEANAVGRELAQKYFGIEL